MKTQTSARKKAVEIAPVSPTYFANNRLKDKVVIITGAARGIGQATAIRASREGASVVIGDWLEREGKVTAASITKEGGQALFVKTDVRKTTDCNRLVRAAVKKFGRIDCGIFCAGVMDGTHSGDPFDYDKQNPLMPASIHAATDEYWNNVFEINATGTFKSMRSVLQQLVKEGKGGAIVTIGSIAGLTGLAGNPAYVASKHAVNGLIRNAAVDYAPYGIRINSVNMAATETPMTAKAYEFVAQSMKRGVGGMGAAKTQSLLMMNDSKNRMATTWEQASLILFLISDEASNLTGGLYATDGGWTTY